MAKPSQPAARVSTKRSGPGRAPDSKAWFSGKWIVAPVVSGDSAIVDLYFGERRQSPARGEDLAIRNRQPEGRGGWLLCCRRYVVSPINTKAGTGVYRHRIGRTCESRQADHWPWNCGHCLLTEARGSRRAGSAVSVPLREHRQAPDIRPRTGPATSHADDRVKCGQESYWKFPSMTEHMTGDIGRARIVRWFRSTNNRHLRVAGVKSAVQMCGPPPLRCMAWFK